MSFRWPPPALRRRARAAGTSFPGRNHARRLARLEYLEDRTLLDASSAVMHPTFVIFHPNGGGLGFNQSPAPIGYTPGQVRKAYGIDKINVGGLVGDGTGQTIAIVDAFDWSTAASDLHNFDVQFGLPDPPSFKKVNQDGNAAPLPPSDAPGGWGVEEALDVEWVHSIAPKASIILVEANAPTDGNLVQTAVRTAASLPGVSVVSMSFGRGEGGGDLGLNSVFQTPNGHTGVTFLASTGDNGAPGGYPAYSPNVVAVGGTSLFLNPDNSYASESGWSGSGGGVSTVQAKPAYQKNLTYASRAIPDVAAIADPNTGVAVYDSYDFGASTPWDQIGGTSLACPFWAGLIGIVNQERVAAGDSILDGPSQTLPLLYGLPASDFHDITTGNNGFPAGPGYDLVTGNGSPVAPNLVRDLSPLSIQVTPRPVGNVQEGLPLNNIVIATFKDLSGNNPPYSATIDWGDSTGTSIGTVTALGGGVYSVTAGPHTYAEEGSYLANIAVSNGGGLTGSGSTTVVVQDAPLSAQPLAFNATEGSRFNGVIGSFTDASPNAPTSDFTVNIDWGDGSNSTGTVTALGNGQFNVSGAKLYREQGNYALKISVKDVGGQSTEIDSTANVADALLSSVGRAVFGVVGTPLTRLLATFTDANNGDKASDYAAAIDWGDGTPLDSAATITFKSGHFEVVGGHTYKHYGTGVYPVHVTITDLDPVVPPSVPPVPPAQTTATSSVALTDASLSSTPQPFNTTEGKAYTGLVATFTSTNPFASALDFNPPSILWGDSPVADLSGTIQPIGTNTGKFGVYATHTYAEEGSYAAAVTITSTGNSTTLATSPVTVLDAGLIVAGQPQQSVAGQTISGSVASFTDTYALGTVDEFTATIDWGDGSPLATVTSNPTADGQIVSTGGGTFNVNATHAYARPQLVPYAVKVTVSEPGGATAFDTTQATVTDAPFTVTPVDLSTQVVTEGGVFSNAVGTFSTPNLLAVPADYVASIDWGDGSTTGGLVTSLGPDPANPTVQDFNITSASPHAYAEEGSYPVKVTVISSAGTPQSGATQANVLDAPILGVASAPKTLVAGNTYSGVVGSFREYAAAPLSDFTATIDWGGGLVTTGQVTAGPSGTFLVSGSNLFKNPGNSAVTISVTDVGNPGKPGKFTQGFNVTDVPILATASPISAVQGDTFTGTVATFTQSNPFADPSQFVASISWGDGSTSTGTVGGSNGSYTVTGTHFFGKANSSQPVNVTITHVVNGTSYASASTNGSAHVLLPVSGFLSHASDNGVSHNDGITSITTPVFLGRAEPGSLVKVYAAPSSNTSARTVVGQTVADKFGNWSVTISPLGDGSYVMTTSMFDPLTNLSAQSRRLATGDFGGPLVIATTGPTVSSVTLNPALSQLRVVFQAGPALMNYPGLVNKANYVLAVPVGASGLSPITPTGLAVSNGPNGTIIVILSYPRGQIGNGTYVVDLHVAGLTDLAGNIVRETKLVAYPQATNSPNPDYIAAINVSGGTASTPHLYVSLAEQMAAYNYSQYVQSRKTVRVGTRAFSVPSGPRFGR